MKTALGIDLSTSATGLVLLGGNPDVGNPICLLEDIVKAPKKETGITRAIAITRKVMETIHEKKPDVIVLEGYSLNMRNASSVIPLVELGGMVRLMMYLDDLKWFDPRATELKKFVTGKGNSKKEEMMMNVLKRWGHTSKSNDTADGYGLACMGLLHLGALWEPPQFQHEVVNALTLKCN